MVQLRRRRTAFALYTLLLVLPTLVLGGLLWHQVYGEHRESLDNVPVRAEDAARRLLAAIESRLNALLESESGRSFHEYGSILSSQDALSDDLALDDDLALGTSPLERIGRPREILAWFCYDRTRGAEAPVDLFLGSHSGSGATALRDELTDAMERFVARHQRDGWLRWAARLESVETLDYPLSTVAVHRGQGDYRDCLRECYPIWRERKVELDLSDFHVQFFLEQDGTPRIVATRRALYFHHKRKVPKEERTPCLEPLDEGFGLVQGFLIDPDWLFREVPRQEAELTLSGTETFLPTGDVCSSCSDYHVELKLVRELGFETNEEQELDYGPMQVALDTGGLEANFRRQTWRFLGVATMLVLSLGTGLALLLRSVGRELEQARRTESFVDSVTHELRTPLSAIRLHGEMLLEGWAEDPDRKREYYRRIVRETSRLSTLVERVLEKSRLSSGSIEPLPGELSEAVGRYRSELAGHTGEDLEFELAADLPPVWLHPEAVRGILANLVENARKYAPPEPGGEPIRVVTRRHDGRVVLEVLDRGPGIPPEEAERIFEAFYRVGNETTRTSKGTGLGLHLVHLHAGSVGARVRVLPRPGGGALFRVRFRSAD